MLISTTPTIEGRPIQAYKGVVTGETIVGANVFKDFLAGNANTFLYFCPLKTSWPEYAILSAEEVALTRKFCVKPKTPRWPKCNNEPNKWAPTPLLV